MVFRRQGMLHRTRGVIVALLAVAAAIVLALPSAMAADDDVSGNFLTPFPENDVYRVGMFGDPFVDGLTAGLLDAFTADVRLNIDRQVTRVPGVMAPDFEAKVAALEQQLGGLPLHVAIVMIGENDRVPIRGKDGRWLAVASEPWISEYARRIDLLMRTFKRKNAAVYWVGLPNFAFPVANDQAQRMNDVIRERAYLNGYKYIDAYQSFADENGAYSAYGPDLEGAIRLLRLRDGVNFTDAGNRKLAHFVEKELRRDLNQAKANRNVPLLGTDAEQAKINPDNAVKTPAPLSPVAAEAAKPKAPVVKGATTDGSAPGKSETDGDQAADNGHVTLKIAGSNGRQETQTIEILRPAIPASVVALMARREGSGQKGDLLVDQISGGLTLMSSITPSGGKNPAKLAPTQAPYFRLLVKGERLQPKPGRSDDMSWPAKDQSTSRGKPDDAFPPG